MKTAIFCGKGGVGKTLCASSLTYILSTTLNKVLLVDYDGGHSVKRILHIEHDIPVNTIHYVESTIWVSTIEQPAHTAISAAKKDESKISEVQTRTATIEKFIILADIITTAIEQRFKYLIIIAEATNELEQLLLNTESTLCSLRNLKGIDIKEINRYITQIATAIEALKHARYLLVCIPEHGPVQQTKEVRSIVESFGGTIYGYVINNMRNEPDEKDTIRDIEETGLPIAYVQRNHTMHLHDNMMEQSRMFAHTGKEICTVLGKDFVVLDSW